MQTPLSRSSEVCGLSMDVVRNIRGNNTTLALTWDGWYRMVKYLHAPPTPCPGCHAGLGICIELPPMNFLDIQRQNGRPEPSIAFLYNHLHGRILSRSRPFRLFTEVKDLGEFFGMASPSSTSTGMDVRVGSSSMESAQHRTLIASTASGLENRSHPVRGDNPTIELRCWANRVLTDSPPPA